jgi:hypothetical protein
VVRCGAESIRYSWQAQDGPSLRFLFFWDIHDLQLAIVANTPALRVVTPPTSRSFAGLLKRLGDPLSGHRSYGNRSINLRKNFFKP